MDGHMSSLGKAALVAGTLLLCASLTWVMPFFPEKGSGEVLVFVVNTLLWALSLFIPVVVLVSTIVGTIEERKDARKASERDEVSPRLSVRVGLGCYICTIFDSYWTSTRSGTIKKELFGTRALDLPRPASGVERVELACACCGKKVVLRVMSADAEQRRVRNAKVAGAILLVPFLSMLLYWVIHRSWVDNFIFAVVWGLGHIVIASMISLCLFSIFRRRLDLLSLVTIAEDTPAVVIPVEHARANGFLSEGQAEEALANRKRSSTTQPQPTRDKQHRLLKVEEVEMWQRYGMLQRYLAR
jgi:hypothetical protein